MRVVRNIDVALLALSQAGDQYVYGAEASPSDENPYVFDCSELVEWVCARLDVDPRVPDGSWLQFQHCESLGTDVSVTRGLGTLGALLFWFDGDPMRPNRPKGAHVAISLGDGRTIEARSEKHGVGVFGPEGRSWTHAALIPGVEY